MPLAAEPSESFVVMAAMMSVRLLACVEELGSSLSQPGSLLIAMAAGEVGAVQEQVAGRESWSAHRHQRDLGQPAVAEIWVSAEPLQVRRSPVSCLGVDPLLAGAPSHVSHPCLPENTADQAAE